jgi:hypothetical protein
MTEGGGQRYGKNRGFPLETSAHRGQRRGRPNWSDLMAEVIGSKKGFLLD